LSRPQSHKEHNATKILCVFCALCDKKISLAAGGLFELGSGSSLAKRPNIMYTDYVYLVFLVGARGDETQSRIDRQEFEA
jgi:hypothetical protein